ncbi:MAG: Na+/H+ antiporter subunit E [Candidatus Thermoplasmatota archaeon]|nr:Na+/H+ antiporter subunit E [Candidatus Thermoplasmatota archaeon]
MIKNKGVHKRDILILSIFLFAFWILLLSDYSFISISFGLIISIIISILTTKMVFYDIRGKRKTLIEYFLAIEHLIGLISTTVFRVIIANGQLISQAITLKIDPKIVRVKVNLLSDAELTIISHLITLTPGTLVIDIEDADDGSAYLYVHFSYLKSKDLGKYIDSTIGQWDRMIGALFK